MEPSEKHSNEKCVASGVGLEKGFRATDLAGDKATNDQDGRNARYPSEVAFGGEIQAENQQQRQQNVEVLFN